MRFVKRLGSATPASTACAVVATRLDIRRQLATLESNSYPLESERTAADGYIKDGLYPINTMF
jgi:hypothetical protein